MQTEDMVQGRPFLFAHCMLKIDYSEYAILFQLNILDQFEKCCRFSQFKYLIRSKPESFPFVNNYFLKLLDFIVALSNNLLLCESVC